MMHMWVETRTTAVASIRVEEKASGGEGVRGHQPPKVIPATLKSGRFTRAGEKGERGGWLISVNEELSSRRKGVTGVPCRLENDTASVTGAYARPHPSQVLTQPLCRVLETRWSPCGGRKCMLAHLFLMDSPRSGCVSVHTNRFRPLRTQFFHLRRKALHRQKFNRASQNHRSVEVHCCLLRSV